MWTLAWNIWAVGALLLTVFYWMAAQRGLLVNKTKGGESISPTWFAFGFNVAIVALWPLAITIELGKNLWLRIAEKEKRNRK